MKIYILSLGNKQRQNKIMQQMEDLGIMEYEFIDSFDARPYDLRELEDKFDIENFQKRYGRLPARGEIGCMMSHMNAWKKIIEEDVEKAIILEDDVILTKRFNYFINDLPEHSVTLMGYAKVSWLRSFYHYIKRPLSNKVFKTNYKYGKIKSEFSSGALGYFLTKKDANALISIFSNSRPYIVADDWDFYKDYIDVYHTRPFIVYEDYKNLESAIDAERVANSNN